MDNLTEESKLKTTLIHFLTIILDDFEFIKDNQHRILHVPSDSIGDVWLEVRKNLESVVNQIEPMTTEQLTNKLSDEGFSKIQVEWEIQDCEVIGEQFHNVIKAFRTGTMVKNPPRDVFVKGLRPLLR